MINRRLKVIAIAALCMSLSCGVGGPGGGDGSAPDANPPDPGEESGGGGNQPPVAYDVCVDPSWGPTEITLDATDADGGPESLTYTVLSGPDHGMLDGSPPNLNYSRNEDFMGPDEFTYKVSDGASESVPAIVRILPSYIEGYNSVYDSGRQVVVTVTRTRVQGETATWERSGDSWTRKALGNPPVAGVMCYDSRRNVTILFGGVTDGQSETWEWDGSRWLKRTPSTAPEIGGFGDMVYDARRGVAVYYFYGATWEWDGTVWNERDTDERPPADWGGRMVYDSARGLTVLFGGSNREGDFNFQQNQTWLWDGTDWAQAHPSTRPPQRIYHAMAYDSVRERVVLFGGLEDDSYTGDWWHLGDTWEWDGTTWIEMQPADSPSPRDLRWGYNMVFEPARRRSRLIGGVNVRRGQDLNGTVWEWDGSAWHRLDVPCEELEEEFDEGSQVTTFDMTVWDQENYGTGSMVWMDAHIAGERLIDSDCCIFRFEIESLDPTVRLFVSGNDAWNLGACHDGARVYTSDGCGHDDDLVVIFREGRIDEDRRLPVRIRVAGSVQSDWMEFEKIVPAQ